MHISTKSQVFYLIFLFNITFCVNNFKKGEEYMNIKVIISLVLCLSLFGMLFVLPTNHNNPTNAEFLRIHIRANSNDAIDQNVKYKVKDSVVKFLTPYLCDAKNKEMAIKIVSQHLFDIQVVCDEVLKNEGFAYVSNAKICKEEFPTRTYNDLTLSAGVYDSLIVNLGSGSGNNWWCVVYPPLCFVASDNSSTEVIYRSKLLEIINSFWRR